MSVPDFFDDYSRRHLCLNPPALASGRLRCVSGFINVAAFLKPQFLHFFVQKLFLPPLEHSRHAGSLYRESNA